MTEQIEADLIERAKGGDIAARKEFSIRVWDLIYWVTGSWCLCFKFPLEKFGIVWYQTYLVTFPEALTHSRNPGVFQFVCGNIRNICSSDLVKEEIYGPPYEATEFEYYVESYLYQECRRILPNEYWQAFILQELDWNEDEISILLEIPPGTVKSRLFRAREALAADSKIRGLSKKMLPERQKKIQ